MKRSIKIAIICASVVFIIAATILAITLYTQQKYKNLPADHVFVTDAKEPLDKESDLRFSDFDRWLLDTINVAGTPSYLIIKDNYVVGLINAEGQFSNDIFKDELATYLINYQITGTLDDTLKVTDIPITSLTGETLTLEQIQNKSNKLTVLEIHRIDCKDCILLDETLTPEIYRKNKDIIDFYRYYIRSDREAVKNKHS